MMMFAMDYPRNYTGWVLVMNRFPFLYHVTNGIFESHDFKLDYKLLAWLFAALFVMALAALAALVLTSPCPDTAQVMAWCKDVACAACLGNVTIG